MASFIFFPIIRVLFSKYTVGENHTLEDTSRTRGVPDPDGFVKSHFRLLFKGGRSTILRYSFFTIPKTATS